MVWQSNDFVEDILEVNSDRASICGVFESQLSHHDELDELVVRVRVKLIHIDFIKETERLQWDVNITRVFCDLHH